MESKEYCLDRVLTQLHDNWNKNNNQRDFLKSEDLLTEFGFPDEYRKHEFFKGLVQRLVDDGYAEYKFACEHNKPSLEFYEQCSLITIEGYYFLKIENGYKGEEERQDTIKIISERRDGVSENTNESVERLNTLLRPIYIIQLIIAGFTLIVVACSVIVAWLNYRDAKPNDDVTKHLQQLDTSISSLRIQSLQQRQLPVKDTVYMIEMKSKK